MSKRAILVHVDEDLLRHLDERVKSTVSLTSRSHAVRVAIALLLRSVPGVPTFDATGTGFGTDETTSDQG